MKPTIMALASLCVVSLVAVTWVLTQVSAAIVYHDRVWGQMDADGARREHSMAEMFHVAGSLHVPVIELLVGIVFLVLLWRGLNQPQSSIGSPGPQG